MVARVIHQDKGFQPLAGSDYRYWLEVTEADGSVSRFGQTEPVRIEPEVDTLTLSAPYPSPAQDTLTISFTLPVEGRVELAVFDISGRRVATLVNGDIIVGQHETVWDCTTVPSGGDLYRLETAEDNFIKRLVISR